MCARGRLGLHQQCTRCVTILGQHKVDRSVGRLCEHVSSYNFRIAIGDVRCAQHWFPANGLAHAEDKDLVGRRITPAIRFSITLCNWFAMPHRNRMFSWVSFYKMNLVPAKTKMDINFTIIAIIIKPNIDWCLGAGKPYRSHRNSQSRRRCAIYIYIQAYNRICRKVRSVQSYRFIYYTNRVRSPKVRLA